MRLEDLFSNRLVTDRGCWEWTGTRWRGYGLRGRGHPIAGRRVHRIAWLLSQPELAVMPSGIVIMHLCENPPCFNPAHLKAGTQAENLSTARWPDRSKNKNVRAKLSESDVEMIRSGHHSLRELAHMFGIDVSHVWRVRERRCWH